MTQVEVSELVAILIAAFPFAKFSDRTASVYETYLMPLDEPVVRKAMDRLITTKKYMPSIAEIREACVETKYGDRRQGGEAWGDVVAAMKRHGYIRTPGVDFTFADPLVARAVDAFGWQDLCSSSETVANRARFIQLYDHLEDNARTEAQTSPTASSKSLPDRRLGSDRPRAMGNVIAELVGDRLSVADHDAGVIDVVGNEFGGES